MSGFANGLIAHCANCPILADSNIPWRTILLRFDPRYGEALMPDAILILASSWSDPKGKAVSAWSGSTALSTPALRFKCACIALKT